MATVKSIDAVQSRIREIEAELAADTRLQELEVLRETAKKLLAISGATPVERHLNGGGQIKLKPKRGGSQPRGKVSQLAGAEMAVRAAGHPLQTEELVALLPRYGAKIGGTNADRNLTSILSKRGDLTSVRWHGKRAWWLNDREPPE